jgi:hypothetical protein
LKNSDDVAGNKSFFEIILLIFGSFYHHFISARNGDNVNHPVIGLRFFRFLYGISNIIEEVY